ncbi:unnamed protein product, partial [Medioppia subpectinata]
MTQPEHRMGPPIKTICVRPMFATIVDIVVLPFRYPFGRGLIHAEGQIAAQHDCLYRYAHDIIGSELVVVGA